MIPTVLVPSTCGKVDVYLDDDGGPIHVGLMPLAMARRLAPDARLAPRPADGKAEAAFDGYSPAEAQRSPDIT